MEKIKVHSFPACKSWRDLSECILKGGVFECLWRPLRRVWRLLCCRGHDGTEIKLSVEETSPFFSGHSSVRPW
ncbi:hypothetical protein QQF64_024397 [Cirrhinus molitorella]|uniref:Uncharacterized protein n=2 Tax=Cirrhinus molitorella TaxID=172907 RepID=A0ABR3NL36_9TELE|nr:hypothetical protein Q8A67_000365 [Cirrhinus molitorella]